MGIISIFYTHFIRYKKRNSLLKEENLEWYTKLDYFIISCFKILLVKIREIKLKLKIINANYQWQINYEIINNNFNKQKTK